MTVRIKTPSVFRSRCARLEDEMNFLIYMIGSTHGEGPGGGMGQRPSPRKLQLANAARHGAAGRFDAALGCYRQLDRIPGAGLTALDLLVRGHLHLMLRQPAEAHAEFARGAVRLLSRRRASSGAAPEVSIDLLLAKADAFLGRGRYARAAELLQETRTLVDLLMGAHAGLALTETLHATSGLAALAKFSDITLRLLARTHLATHLADSLRRRHLREDLAPWATTPNSVETLLESEYQRLGNVCRHWPEHAESHYRLGLVARATRRPEQAAVAFARTLRLHPHHLPSAARLAATLLELQRPAGMREVLERAFRVPAETLALYAGFARAAASGATFDVTAEKLCTGMSREQAQVLRANLAFALSELAILDPQHSAWREGVGAGK